MNTEESRSLLHDFYGALRRGDREHLLEILAEDVEWRMPESVDNNIVTGRAAVMQELSGETVKRLFQKGTFELHVHRIFADGDTVIAQTSTNAITKSGKPYVNEYAWVYTCRDGKVCYIREYLDTASSFKMLEWKL
jgi:ketosteroid isomerase-like protein